MPKKEMIVVGSPKTAMYPADVVPGSIVTICAKEGCPARLTLAPSSQEIVEKTGAVVLCEKCFQEIVDNDPTRQKRKGRRECEASGYCQSQELRDDSRQKK